MKVLIIISLILAIASCSKTNGVKKSPEIFIGEWQWTYSVIFEYNQNTQDYDINDTIKPNFNSIIKVKKNGNLIIYEDGIKMSTVKGDFIAYSDLGSNVIRYSSPSSSLKFMNGVYSFISMISYNNSDSIRVLGYPYHDKYSPYSNEVANQNINKGGIIIYNFFTRK
jgi:hypothetical protein